jgi:hypothetical protein
MKSILAFAALAAIGFAGAAYAGDATAPKIMSDSERDKVTAGATLLTINPPGRPGKDIVLIADLPTLSPKREHPRDLHTDTVSPPECALD